MIVVTGAAGFIGSNLVATLNENRFKDLVLVDDFSRKDKEPNWSGKIFSEKIHENLGGTSQERDARCRWMWFFPCDSLACAVRKRYSFKVNPSAAPMTAMAGLACRWRSPCPLATN